MDDTAGRREVVAVGGVYSVGVYRGVLGAGMQQPQSVHLQNDRMGRMTLMPVNPKRCVCVLVVESAAAMALALASAMAFSADKRTLRTRILPHAKPVEPPVPPLFCLCLTLTHMNANGVAAGGGGGRGTGHRQRQRQTQ